MNYAQNLNYLKPFPGFIKITDMITEDYKEKYGIKKVGVTYLEDSTKVTVHMVDGSKKVKIFEADKSMIDIVEKELPDINQRE